MILCAFLIQEIDIFRTFSSLPVRDESNIHRHIMFLTISHTHSLRVALFSKFVYYLNTIVLLYIFLNWMPKYNGLFFDICFYNT